MTFPNLVTIDSISIINAGNLKRFHAPKLRTVSHWLSLTNITQFVRVNLAALGKDSNPSREISVNIGYYPSGLVNIGSYFGRHDLTGNVVLSNVSQSIVDKLIANPDVSLPSVENPSSPVVHHVNYSANQAVNLTVRGTGDTKLTLNGHLRSSNSIQSVYISGVKEINTDRSKQDPLKV